MSTEWVVDASVGFSWIHPAQSTPETDQLLEGIGTHLTIIVPPLWFLEMANGLLILQRRKRFTREERHSVLGTITSLNLLVDEEAGRLAFRKMSDLAEDHGLTVYDAIYLEIALRRRIALASRDAALNAAAKRCGIAVL